MAGEVDAMLDAGSASLQHFKEMLEIAERIAPGGWPDWRDHFARSYDFERGIDIDALRSDADMVRAQSEAAVRERAIQDEARTAIQRVWPDVAGAAAVRQLGEHHRRAEPIARVLRSVADALDRLPEVVLRAVSEKVRRLNDFKQSTITSMLRSAWSVSIELIPMHQMFVPATPIRQAVIDAFVARLRADIALFDRIVADTSDTIRSAYDAVCVAAESLDTSPFPAPSFSVPQPASGCATGEGAGRMSSCTPAAGAAPNPRRTRTAPAIGAGSAPTGGGAVGATAGTSVGSHSAAAPSPTPVAPSAVTEPTAVQSVSPGVNPMTPQVQPGGWIQPAQTMGSGAAGLQPGFGQPGFGVGGGASPAGMMSGAGPSGTGGMPSWLATLIPKLAEQLGLGGPDSAAKESGAYKAGLGAEGRHGPGGSDGHDDPADHQRTKGAGKHAGGAETIGKDGAGKDGAGKDGAGKDGAGKDGAGKDGAGKSGAGKESNCATTTTTTTTDGSGRTVSATLRPDGVTVDVTVTRPDGSVDRATLAVGVNGALTATEVGPGAQPTAAEPGSSSCGAPHAGEHEVGRPSGSPGAGVGHGAGPGTGSHSPGTHGTSAGPGLSQPTDGDRPRPTQDAPGHDKATSDKPGHGHDKPAQHQPAPDQREPGKQVADKSGAGRCESGEQHQPSSRDGHDLGKAGASGSPPPPTATKPKGAATVPQHDDAGRTGAEFALSEP